MTQYDNLHPEHARKLREGRQKFLALLTWAVLGKTDMRRSLQPGTFERYRRVLGRTRNVELILLKGHLLIEEAMVELVALRCADRERIGDMRLGFEQKVTLIQALFGKSADDSVIAAARKLNSARNQLAHVTTPAVMSEQLDDYIQLVWPDLKHFASTQRPAWLKKAVAFHLGVLAGLAEAMAQLDPSPGSLKGGPKKNAGTAGTKKAGTTATKKAAAKR